MRLLPHHHGDLRGRAEPVPVGVVAVREQDGAPAGGERGEVGHRRARDERDPRIRRQVERFEHPPHRDPLDRGTRSASSLR